MPAMSAWTAAQRRAARVRSAVIHILEGFGFIVHAQLGSHVKLRRTRYRRPASHFPAGKPVHTGSGTETSLFHRFTK